ncbi:MAG: rRNA pseudouridine synthase [Oscillospiraceae bacterium]|jgi:23S rRNA pseudouridine2605 synthase|nr:rRNA pseudouridine synthase [Oscillospiraceae bacterium]
MSNHPERLQKILSASGVSTRREAERIITQGRVSVNGEIATLGQSADILTDVITVDGVRIAQDNSFVYIMLNKPRGYLTTVSDDRGRKTVMELVADVHKRIYPVGRLDLDSEGLLLFTNDGDFANKVMHPSYEKLKTYTAYVKGDVEKAAALLLEPIIIDDYTVRAKKTRVLEKTTNGGTLEITIIEGRNRQVRKMCASVGLSVQKLKRISIDTLNLGTLETGKWRYLTKKEVESLG